MIKAEALTSIFNAHGIEQALLIPTKNKNIFLIKDMSSDISLNRWEHLEHILKDIYQKECDIMSYEYASKYINIKEEAIIIQWKTDILY